MTRTAPKADRLPETKSGEREEISITREIPVEPIDDDEVTRTHGAPIPSEVRATRELTIPVQSNLERTLQHEALRRQSADDEEAE